MCVWPLIATFLDRPNSPSNLPLRNSLTYLTTAREDNLVVASIMDGCLLLMWIIRRMSLQTCEFGRYFVLLLNNSLLWRAPPSAPQCPDFIRGQLLQFLRSDRDKA